MAFDAFSPDYFSPGGFAPGLLPGASQSPSAAYANSVSQAQVNAASLQVPQTPAFIPAAAPVQQIPPSSGNGVSAFAALFPSTNAPLTLPPTMNEPSPPTMFVDQETQTISMPAPTPPNPVTFPPSPPQGPPIPAGALPITDPNVLFWSSLFEG